MRGLSLLPFQLFLLHNVYINDHGGIFTAQHQFHRLACHTLKLVRDYSTIGNNMARFMSMDVPGTISRLTDDTSVYGVARQEQEVDIIPNVSEISSISWYHEG